jgi:hypothetical protein
VRLEALFEAHQQIAADIGQAQTAHQKDIDDYIAGQQEALNRVEELITLMVTDDWHLGLGEGDDEWSP